jgi:hypothetical protein
MYIEYNRKLIWERIDPIPVNHRSIPRLMLECVNSMCYQLTQGHSVSTEEKTTVVKDRKPEPCYGMLVLIFVFINLTCCFSVSKALSSEGLRQE